MPVEKEGRRISAKMRAKLEEAIVHTENALKVYRSVLADDQADRDEAKAARLLRNWSQADTYM